MNNSNNSYYLFLFWFQVYSWRLNGLHTLLLFVVSIVSFLRGYSVWEMKSYIPYLVYVRIHTYVYIQKTWPFFEVVNYNLLQNLVWPITSSSTLLIHCLVYDLYYVACSIQSHLFYKSTLGCVIWHIESNASYFKNVYLRLEMKTLLDTIMLCIRSKTVFRNNE